MGHNSALLNYLLVTDCFWVRTIGQPTDPTNISQISDAKNTPYTDQNWEFKTR